MSTAAVDLGSVWCWVGVIARRLLCGDALETQFERMVQDQIVFGMAE